MILKSFEKFTEEDQKKILEYCEKENITIEEFYRRVDEAVKIMTKFFNIIWDEMKNIFGALMPVLQKCYETYEKDENIPD